MVGKLDGYEVLGRTGSKQNNVDTTLPTANAALTLYQSNWTSTAGKGARFKMIIFNVFSSHASATNGYVVSESSDGGATWDDVQTNSISASTYTKVYTKVSAPEVRVKYTNSGTNTTTFRWSLLGDTEERGNG